MSTIQQNQSSGFSPVLLSPTSTTHPTITTSHHPFYDNSDQGSVDSDYTSLSSSRFYGHGGSTSSLHRQGRSQSIDELASNAANTTTIPTRHFHGISHVNKSNTDPLQFVKIHPNHDLIERAQEQLTLAESRKRLQETFKIIPSSALPSKIHPADDEDNDWSKAVENWRQKREQKRKQSLNANRTDDEPTIPVSTNLDPPPRPSPIEKVEPAETKISLPTPKVLPPAASVRVQLESPKPSRTVSKSPSPQRIRGPSKIHEISIEKPLDIRGFGFKLEDGAGQNRPVYISTIEEGSLADKAGLCIDDEVLSMNGENTERMSFDQVRKILKERNLRGSIKLLVRTYEDVIDDNSQTVTVGPATDHSRTPSPQKMFTLSQSNLPAPPVSTSSNTILLPNTMSTTASKEQAPVYTFSPSASIAPPSRPVPPPPPPPSINNIPIKQSTTLPSTAASLTIFAPKPFRSSTSVNLDSNNQSEFSLTHSSTIEAFRKMLDTSNSMNQLTKTESTATNEQQPTTITQKLSSPQELSNKPYSSSINPTQPDATDSLISHKLDAKKPAPLSSVETLLHETRDQDSNAQHRNESPITQVRTSVEKQMNQLQKELLIGFPNASNDSKRDQKPVSIPIDLTNAALQKPAVKKSFNEQPELHSNKTRPLEQQMSSSNQTTASTYMMKSSVQDAPMNMRPSTAPQSVDRLGNQPHNHISPTYSSKASEKLPVQLDSKIPSQRISSKQIHTSLNQAPKKTSHEDRSWISNDLRMTNNSQPTPVSQQIPGYQNGTGRRPAPVPPGPAQSTPLSSSSTRSNANPLSMFHYGDHSDEVQHQSRHSEYNRDVGRQQHHKQHTKSPIRTTINSNNNRVLSVSGKLRCSRCNDELGQGSAMVIESLSLYYHIECFRCFVCNIPLSSSFEGTDVRVRDNRLHCQNCFSDGHGVWRSNV